MKATITLEGSVEEIRPILHFISEQDSSVQKANAEEIITQNPEEVAESVTFLWTEPKIRDIWRGLTFECRDVLRELAKHKYGISWHSLLDNLNLKANQVGGRLSSLGHQIRIKGYGGLPYPIEVTGALVYKLDSLWRQIMRKMQEEIDAIGTSGSETVNAPHQ
jgi:hypothetical protein